MILILYTLQHYKIIIGQSKTPIIIIPQNKVPYIFLVPTESHKPRQQPRGPVERERGEEDAGRTVGI